MDLAVISHITVDTSIVILGVNGLIAIIMEITMIKAIMEISHICMDILGVAYRHSFLRIRIWIHACSELR
jgi:hypothetical protein